jgi:hypothetical protein
MIHECIMGDRIKDDLGGRKQSRKKQAESYDLSDKPFAKALLFRASHYQDTAKEVYAALGGRRPFTEDPTLEEFAASCAVTIAHYITTRSMESIGRELCFMPYNPPPKDAPMVVAFSLMILAGIYGQLEADGIKIDFREATMDTANLFYLFRPDNERAQYAIEGIQMFQALAEQTDRDNIRKWNASLMELIPVYVLQWTTDNDELKKFDHISLFGSMLSGLLKAVQ